MVDLVLLRREHEFHNLIRQCLVNAAEGFELIITILDILRVEVYFEHFLSVDFADGALADDLCWVADVVEDSLVHSGKGAAAWTGLTLRFPLVLRERLQHIVRNILSIQHRLEKLYMGFLC